MKTSRARIASTISDMTLKGGNRKAISQQIAAYLISERRVKDLDSLMRDVQNDWAKAGYLEVIAASSHPLTASSKADISARVKKLYPDTKQIIITEVHDAKVLGGVRLSLPNQQLDLSIEAKLNKFKQLTTA